MYMLSFLHLKEFAGIECQWPMFFLYIYLSAMFEGKKELADEYWEKTVSLLVDWTSEEDDFKGWCLPLCVCVCVYVCMCVFICLCACIHHVCMYTCVHLCVHVYSMCEFLCMMKLHVFTLCVCVCMYVCVCMHMCACMNA